MAAAGVLTPAPASLHAFLGAFTHEHTSDAAGQTPPSPRPAITSYVLRAHT